MFSPVAITHKPDWIKDVLHGLTDNVYISLDIDGLDPAYAPGTGTPEPGGLTYQQLVDLFLAVGKNPSHRRRGYRRSDSESSRRGYGISCRTIGLQNHRRRAAAG